MHLPHEDGFEWSEELYQAWAGEIAALLSSYAAENARSEAAAIASAPETQRAFETGNFSELLRKS